MCSSLLWDQAGVRRRKRGVRSRAVASFRSADGVWPRRPGCPPESSHRDTHTSSYETRLKRYAPDGAKSTWPGPSPDEPFELRERQGEVQVLDRLHRGALEQVVLGGDHHRVEPVLAGLEATHDHTGVPGAILELGYLVTDLDQGLVAVVRLRPGPDLGL